MKSLSEYIYWHSEEKWRQNNLLGVASACFLTSAAPIIPVFLAALLINPNGTQSDIVARGHFTKAPGPSTASQPYQPLLQVIVVLFVSLTMGIYFFRPYLGMSPSFSFQIWWCSHIQAASTLWSLNCFNLIKKKWKTSDQFWKSLPGPIACSKTATGAGIRSKQKCNQRYAV